MGKIYAFILGLAAGFGLHHLAGANHVVRSESGMHLVSKVSNTLDDTYVDIRGFGPAEWAKHPELAAAVAKSDESDLKRDALNESLDKVLPGLGGE